MSIIKKISGNFPGGPGIKTLHFHCREFQDFSVNMYKKLVCNY